MVLKNYPHKPLTQWLKNNGMSVETFANLLNISVQHANFILNLKRGTSRELAKKIHLITNISIEDILYPNDKDFKNKAA